MIAEYALEHPERPLSGVSAVEFLLWRDMREAQSIAEGRRAGKMVSFAPAPWEYAPDLIIQDEVHELKTTRSVEKMRDYAERHRYTAKQVTYVTKRPLDSGRLPPTYIPPMHNARPCSHRWVPWQEATDNLKPLDRCAECRETRDRPVASEGFAEASPINEPQCDECGGSLPADAIADGSRLCSPECVDDYYGPVSE